MADRRRINGPSAATYAPMFDEDRLKELPRTRSDNAVRGVFLKTGVTPTASGSAYLEVEHPGENVLTGRRASGMKLTCTVHGPRALPRSSPFSPHLVLSTHVKFAPFATRQRRAYLRDSSERDLSVHLETALRGAIIADRWPKSGVDVIVTIIEGDQERLSSQGSGNEEWDLMNVLSACITVSSAAISDAGIDCVDIVVGGVAALTAAPIAHSPAMVLDPAPSESLVLAACCVAYLPERDEISSLWMKGQLPPSDALTHIRLVTKAIQAARGSAEPLKDSLTESISKRGRA